ncbi:Formylmethanofuran dehydrogenase subunit B [Methylophaga frappieri]|uniref:Formylmethanofuran dehydrogenase subunit B n=1 Tax=Methylophaga frappieri (strain ATCC BAA-2434 / DSM 25690 / JAM7) TaxID=754477 RepID=I1YJL2_METFJ|nr:formylmethanofuran dehydrogenase subunit B [Methylophaga frappieri]AFJ03105.1 Formylmethanofuran dehydrogenase subunit B [Methylophaga frappieri]
MTDTDAGKHWQEIASPFCGIASDDLTVRVQDLSVTVEENADAVTRPGFETPLAEMKPMLHGQETTLEKAVSYIAKQLRAANQPVIGGLGTDLNGARAALSLADRSGAVVDSQFSTAAFRNILVLQDTGYMTTTLTEVRNRADVIVVVGGDIETAFPRFYERIVWPEESMFDVDINQRRIIYLGKAPSGEASTSPSGQKAQVMTCDDHDLPEVLSVLRALINNRPVQATSVGGISVSDLQQLTDELKQASYSVFTWSGSLLNFDHAETSIQTLCEAIKELNKETRSSGLPLGGKEGDTTVNAVASWQTGYPMRTSFQRGYPEYDPFLFDTQRMVINNEVDFFMWINAFNTEGLPPSTVLPDVVIGRSGMQFNKMPEVFIPVGVPGIDHEGRIFRCDSVVSMPLRKLRQSDLPSVSEVLKAVEQAMQE